MHLMEEGVGLKCSNMACNCWIFSNDTISAQHYLNAHGKVHRKKSTNDSLIIETPTEKPASDDKVLPALKADVKLKDGIPKTLKKTKNGKNFNISIQQENVIYFCTICGFLVPQFCKREFENHTAKHDLHSKGVHLNCNDCDSEIYSDDIITAEYYLKEHVEIHKVDLSSKKIPKTEHEIEIHPNFYPFTESESRGHYCMLCNEHIIGRKQKSFDNHINKMHLLEEGVGLKCSNMACNCWIFSNDTISAQHYLNAHGKVHTKKSRNDNLIIETPTEIPASANIVLPALKTDVALKDNAPKTLKKNKIGKKFNVSIQQKKVIYYCTVCGFLVPQFCKRNFESHIAKHDLHSKGVHLKCNDCDSEIYSDDIITAEYYLKEHVEIHKVDLSSKKIPKTEHQIEIHPNFYPLTENESRGHYCILCNEHIIGRKQKSFDNHINKMHPLEKGVRLKCSDLICNRWIFSAGAQHYLNAHGKVHKMNSLSLKFTENMDEPNFDAQAELEDATKTRRFYGFVTACEQLKNNIVSEVYFCRQCNIFLTSKTNLENHIRRKHVEGLIFCCIYCKCEIYPNDDISFSYMDYHNDLCHSSIHKETKPSIVEINTNNGCNQAFLDVVEKKSSRLDSSYQPNFDGVCLLCNLTFIDRFEWMDHLDTHIGAKEATCQKCFISCYGAEDDFTQCFEHPSHLDLDLNF